jgi:anti-sigma factor RsiW
MSTTQGAGKPVSADAELELLSAWLDGELEPGQYNVILDRLKTDPALRAQFEWFNLAGDALRSHEVAACDDPALVGQVRYRGRNCGATSPPASRWLRRPECWPWLRCRNCAARVGCK